jgi:hypothetical protein
MKTLFNVRYYLVCLLIIVEFVGFGQTTIKGQLKDYRTGAIISFVNISKDTVAQKVLFSKPYEHYLGSQADSNGNFKVEIYDTAFNDITFSFVGYYALSIRNISLNREEQTIDLGDVFLFSRGVWVEGYRPDKSKDIKTRRMEKKAWQKDGIPNSGSFFGDSLGRYKGKNNILIEYPLHGSKKCFIKRGEMLVIDYVEFIKDR